MQKHRAAGPLGGEVRHGTAVVADGRVEPVDASGRQPGDRAAHAIADHADLVLVLLERLDGGPHVDHHGVPADLAPDLAAPDDVFLLVAELDVGLDPVEERRRQRHVAIGSVAVADAPDVRVHAKDLLDDDDTAPGLTRRVRAVATEPVAVLRLQRHVLTHAWSPFDQLSTVVRWRSMRSKSMRAPRPGPPGARTSPWRSTSMSSTRPYFWAPDGRSTSKNSQLRMAIVTWRLATLFSELPPWWISKFMWKASARCAVLISAVMPPFTATSPRR